MRQATINGVARGVSIVTAVAAVGAVALTFNAVSTADRAAEVREQSLLAANDIRESSAGLTADVRAYTAAGDPYFLDAYWQEIEVDQHQAKAIEMLQSLDTPESELALIREATANSATLVETETRAQRLVLEARGVPEAQMPQAVAGFQLDPAESALEPAQKEALAGQIVTDEAYRGEQAKILTSIQQFDEALGNRVQGDVDSAAATRTAALVVLALVTFLAAASLFVLTAVFQRLNGAVIQRYTSVLHDTEPQDLRVRLEPEGVEEMQHLAEAFNERSAQTQDLVEGLSDNAVSLAGVSTQLNATAADMNKRVDSSSNRTAAAAQVSQNVSGTMSTLASATEEMSASISEISRSAQNASRVAAEASMAAETTSSTVSRLGDSSQQIGEVIKTITSVAEQTNLLALNATIEAARAGEAGKGFAVVANEVKELAEQTAAATEDISRRVEGIQGDAADVAVALGGIVEIIARINDEQTAIAGAVEEQTATTNEMSRSVREAADGTADIADSLAQLASDNADSARSMGDTTSATQEMAQMAESFSALVSGYRTH